ncbi:MAG: hypothetical protein HZA62_16135 [Rhodocyclales bacterium]|nr:hypothetical protein [Rhodocyclales bacterium]
MDETAYRNAKGEINRLPCVFERALLARHAVCELAASHQIAERETVACSQAAAHADCTRLAEMLRAKSAFALGVTDTHGILPHAMLMKIQCGGLDGMKRVFDPDALAANVRRLLRLAQDQCGGLESLPFSEIVKGVAAWKGRRRRAGDPS